MAYSDFDLRRAVTDFGLRDEWDTNLFHEISPLPISPGTRSFLDQYAPVAIGINSEFARCNYIITPILTEAERQAVGPAHVFPGVTLDVDQTRGLSGFCDYLISRAHKIYYLRSPIVAVMEAKREDIIGGLGQCAAAMVAIREFNERDGTPIPEVFGCVTTGSLWRFLRLTDSVLSIDLPEYYLQEVAKIVGIFVHLIGTGIRPVAS